MSDKGRKFFKYFRQLMIEGKMANGNKIPSLLAKAFFMLNIAIEAATNNVSNNLAYNFNTNLLIERIYKAIIKNKTNHSKIRISNIHRVDEAGNPLDYYLTIMEYLKNNDVKIIPLILLKSASSKMIESLLVSNNINKKPDVIVLEIYDNGENGPGYSGIIKDKEIKLNLFGVSYVLDSAIVRDTEANHFCSLLTCNKKEYSFDGASFNRLNLMNWKKLINSNKTWNFKGHDLKWNFRNSYQLLFYYRI